MTKTFKKGRLTVFLDKAQVFPNDPGLGTPAMVTSGNYNATYWCATGTGVLMGNDGDLVLTPKEIEWLDNLDFELTNFLYRD